MEKKNALVMKLKGKKTLVVIRAAKVKVTISEAIRALESATSGRPTKLEWWALAEFR